MNDERAWRRGGSGVEGNVRTAAIWTQVRALSESRQRELSRPLRVLDLGGGTGGLAVALAEQGHTVTVVDPSPDALASLSRRVAESDAASRISAVQGDADTLAGTVEPGSIDLLCCHGTLEYVEDPTATLARIDVELADSELKAPRDGRVQFRVVQPGDLPAARARAVDVLHNMVEAGFLTEGQIQTALRNPATPVTRTRDITALSPEADAVPDVVKMFFAA